MTYLYRYGMGAILFAIFAGAPFAAFAADTDAQFDKIAENIVKGSDQMPALIAAFSYLLALLFAVTGILKLKEHVNNPTQVPLRVALIRFLVGGALLALPMLYQAMAVAINGGENPEFDPSTTVGNMLSDLLGGLAGYIPLSNANNVMEQVIDSIEQTPALVSAIAYMLALLFGVSGLLKLKEHVENPEQTPLREAVIRLLAGGALFAIPMVYSAMFELVGTSIMGNITSVFGAIGMIFSSYTLKVCNPVGGFIGGLFGGTSMGDAICGVFFNAGAFPAFMTAIAYLLGLILGVWGILKIKAHVLNPQQTSLWEGVSRLAAGGAFFALPFIIEVARNTITPPVTGVIAAVSQATGFNETAMACDGTSGLDGILYCMMDDITTPMHVVINFFTTSAAFVFAMIGISRLTKSAQDGARGPGGLGTLMTFAAAGALLSYNALVRTATVTLGMGAGIGRTSTNAVMEYTKGLNAAEKAHVHTVISAIIKFMIIVGLISFVRGIFIIRSVAEGNSQASLMAGVTHMVGGALAVNLGPLINAVQTTLGINEYGITFS
ncbi:MAG: hypothetical protein WBK55_07050 [Alphaproteobacteria bacterium]